MQTLEINIKAANDNKFRLSIGSTSTILNLKELICKDYNIPVESQKLIYSGKVLKDLETLEAYKVSSGNTIHLIKTVTQTKESSPSPSVPQNLAAGTNISNPLSQITGARYAGQIPLPNASMFGPDAGYGNSSAFPIDNPDEMIRMLENPMVQSQINEMWQNPEFIDIMLNSMPQFRNAPSQVRQIFRSAEFRRMLTDPTVIRQMANLQQTFGSSSSNFPTPGDPLGDEGATINNNASNNGTETSDNTSRLGNLFALLNSQTNIAGRHDNVDNSTANMSNLFNPNFLNEMLSNSASNLSNAISSENSNQQQLDSTNLEDHSEERLTDQITQLVSMGFDYQRAKRACLLSNGNVEVAIEMLLNELI